MKIELMFYSHHENLDEFKRKTIKSQYDSLILVADGEYSMLVGGGREKIKLRKNEIAFIPAHIEFNRCVDAPVTYYNICFLEHGNHPFYEAASTGVLKLPYSNAEAIFESMRRVNLLPESRDLITHITERIFVENYLFGGKNNDKTKGFSDEIANAIQYLAENLDKKIEALDIQKEKLVEREQQLVEKSQELEEKT